MPTVCVVVGFIICLCVAESDIVVVVQCMLLYCRSWYS